MTNEYFDIVNAWERRVADPFIFDHLYALLPEWNFRRVGEGTSKDRWVSPLKMDLSRPKRPNAEKTVVNAFDMKMREQGDWDNAVSVVDMLVQRNALDNKYQYYAKLSERYSLEMPMPDSAQVKAATRRNARRRDILSTLADYFKYNLFNMHTQKASKTLSYLMNKRGFSAQSIEQIGFGFVPQWSSVVTYMTTKKGFTKEELDVACPVCNDEGRTMVGRTHVLAIPYMCSGVLKGFIFRRVDGNDSPKYIAQTGLDRKSEFFNYPEGGSEVIAVVEGEMDALSSTAAGIPGVVAVGGSDISGDRRRQVERALAAGTRKIILCFDLDTTTDTATGELIPNLEKRFKAVMRTVHTIKDVDINFEEIYVAEFPHPTDPDEYVRQYGFQGFVKLLRDAKPWWKYVSEYKDR